jgi:flagellum-specific peptidoglycan hydrolase FlgJ
MSNPTPPSHPASKHHHHQKHHHRTAHHAATEAFIKQAATAAQASELQTGVPASVTIAQAIIESGWGHSHFGTANNYFGIKAQTKHVKHGKGTKPTTEVVAGPIANGYVTAPTHENVKGKLVKVKANFRSYKNMSDSFTDHGEFLRANKRYAKAFQDYASDHDADNFATNIAQAGYANDGGGYAEKLISMMKHHNLYQYNLPAPKK